MVICDFCGSSENTFIVQMQTEKTFSITRNNTDNKSYYKCKKCNLFFKHPRHREKALESFYSSEYHEVRYRQNIDNILSRIPTNIVYIAIKAFIYKFIYALKKCKQIRIESYLKKYMPSTKNAAILEIGGGTTPLLYLSCLGYSYMGVEPSVSVINYFNKRGYKNIKQGFAENLDFISSESVDAIICVGSIAYVSDISKVLFEFWRILKKGGFIFAIDINVDTRCNLTTYGNYGLSKDFLLYLKSAKNPYELCEDYFYLNAKNEIVNDGPKKFFILRKKCVGP